MDAPVKYGNYDVSTLSRYEWPDKCHDGCHKCEGEHGVYSAYETISPLSYELGMYVPNLSVEKPLTIRPNVEDAFAIDRR